MRVLGLASAAIALLTLAYAWFAAGWDGGTSREVGDRVMMGVALLLLVASVAIFAGKRWGIWLAAPLWVIIAVVAMLPA